MSNQTPLHFPPLPYSEFWSLPDGFGYKHEISEASNTVAFDTGLDKRDSQCCVVCGIETSGGYKPNVERAHVIGQKDTKTVRSCLLLRQAIMNFPQWNFLRATGFVPAFAKSVVHEPRNGITLCRNHHSDFDGYRYFIRWAPSVSLDSKTIPVFY